MRQKTKNQWKLALLCYAVAAVMWLVAGAGFLVRDAVREQNGETPWKSYSLENLWGAEDMGESGIELWDNWQEERWFVTTYDDAKIYLYFPEGAYINNLVFTAKPLNRGQGETVLYYTIHPGAEADEKHKRWAMQPGQDEWYFDVGGKKVYTLRLDPATAGGVLWQFTGLEINRPVPWYSYFVPDGRWALVLLFAPLLLWALVGEGVAFVRPIITRRRFTRQHK